MQTVCGTKNTHGARLHAAQRYSRENISLDNCGASANVAPCGLVWNTSGANGRQPQRVCYISLSNWRGVFSRVRCHNVFDHIVCDNKRSLHIYPANKVIVRITHFGVLLHGSFFHSIQNQLSGYLANNRMTCGFLLKKGNSRTNGWRTQQQRSLEPRGTICGSRTII